jgi:hypothetical protein
MFSPKGVPFNNTMFTPSLKLLSGKNVKKGKDEKFLSY